MSQFVMCPACREVVSLIDAHEHVCQAPAPAAQRGFTAGGKEWTVGVRVQTRCALASATKEEFPAGSAGCVFKVSEEDALVWVSLDAEDLRACVVQAEPSDLIHRGLLQHGTKVLCRDLALSFGATQKHIKQGAEGVIIGYVPETNKYSVNFTQLRVMANVPVQLVHPAEEKLPVAPVKLMERVRSFGLLRKASLRLKKALSPGRAADASAASRSCSEESCGAPREIQNLGKTPQYSNLRGSPRSPRSVLSESVQTLHTAVSFDSLTDLLPGVARSESERSDADSPPETPRRQSPTLLPRTPSLVQLATKDFNARRVYVQSQQLPAVQEA
eukprot:TRINITY_DN21094_c0_g1_i1.p1 TRINITY_DN21094_c0_g1~~TRINITY_DN21094_c0_g1_i1.p1  ORF type:complete len:348 (+),score=119.75 TRINITY_DN21094_c0_g1_i1:55-1044(+)